MILRSVCWSIFLCLVLGPAVRAQVTVDDQGYQNVMISFAPNTDDYKGEETVEKIRDLITSASSVLHKAIGIRIASATILIPLSWSTAKWKNITVTLATPAQTARKVDIQVDATKESPFGQQPLSLQYGVCGVPGLQITLPQDFLAKTEGYPKGKLLAREWLKYRYGVFDENGFLKDYFYPDYYKIPGGTDIRFTDCTNSKVTYKFKKPFSDELCNMDLQPNFGYCRTFPDEKSAVNVTSSLMYFHEDLRNMEHVCGKDGNPHNSLARNKQNALCNGQSIWDVIKSSNDFKKTRHQSVNPDTESVKFSYVQEGDPRFVVLLENSDNLFKQQSVVRFAVRRLYYDLPTDSKFALYTYNSDVTEVLPYTKIPYLKRKDLGTIADFKPPTTSICTSCGLEKATQILLEKSEVEKGSILLITASPLDKVPALSPKLKEAGICLHVLRFTDENNPADGTYDALAKYFYCFSQESLHINLDVVNVFNAMLRFMENSGAKFDDKIVFKTVATGNMSSEVPLTIPQVAYPLLYTLWLSRNLTKDSIKCKVGPVTLRLEPDITATDLSSFTFDPTNDNVTCRLVSSEQQPLLAQVQMVTEQDFVFDTWIHDLSTEKEQRPIIIYTKLYFGGYPIKKASVTVVVKSLKQPEEVAIMLDNGRGDPDVTQYDGIYSGYFSNFLEAGDYQIRIKIDDNYENAMIGKQDPELGPSPCCGSEVVSKDVYIPAFKMAKTVLYRANNSRPKDGYPPSRILDLIGVRVGDKVTLLWSAPGGGKAVKYDIKVFESREDAITKFDSKGKELNTSSMLPKVPGDSGTPSRIYVSLTPFEIGVTNYVAIRSWNEFGKPSEISSVVEFMNPKPIDEPTSTPGGDHESTPGGDHESTTGGGITDHDSGNKTLGIVLGVLGGLAVLIALALLGYYYFVRKPRRR